MWLRDSVHHRRLVVGRSRASCAMTIGGIDLGDSISSGHRERGVVKPPSTPQEPPATLRGPRRLRVRRPLACAVLSLSGLLVSAGVAQVQNAQSQEVVDRLYATVVQIRVPELGARGSGSIISPDGYILTNDHVMREEGSGRLAQRADVYMMAGPWDEIEHRFIAEFVRSDPVLDLGVLRIISDRDGNAVEERFSHLSIGDFKATGLKLADELTTWGYPAFGGAGLSAQGGVVGGFLAEIDPTLFVGLGERAAAADPPVSVAVMRERLFALVPNGDRWIRTDATFTSGVSGGAAIDRSGLLVGVPTAVIIDSPQRLVRPAIYARTLLADVSGVVYVPTAVDRVVDVAPVGLAGLNMEATSSAMTGLVRYVAAADARLMELLDAPHRAAACDESALRNLKDAIARIREHIILLRSLQVRTRMHVRDLEAHVSGADTGTASALVAATEQNPVLENVLEWHREIVTHYATTQLTLSDAGALLQREGVMLQPCSVTADFLNLGEFVQLLYRDQEALDLQLHDLYAATRVE
jgi:S1-C subfamily serine protease